MKIVIRTLFFHILNIVIFTLIYFSLSKDFEFTPGYKVDIFDFILYATTIQVGVGISQLYPLTTFGKLLVTLQQFIMLCTHVITLYVFTI